MPMNRFFIDATFNQNTCVFVGDELHHMTKVMRFGEKDEVELVNGKGDLAIAKIEKVEKKQALLSIISVSRSPPLSLQLQLAIPWMRPPKLQWIVEKATELGVSAFLFYQAERSEIKVLSQLERLRAILIAALKQSGRLYLPSIEIKPDLISCLNQDRIYFGDPKNSDPFPTEVPNHFLFVTGPESGFTPDEQKILEERGTGVRLGPHILRAETAPIAAAAICLAKTR